MKSPTPLTRPAVDGLLDMPGPFQMLNPELLLMLGFGALSIAVGLFVASVLNARFGGSGVAMGTRQRYLMALSFAGSGIGGLRYHPSLPEVYGYLSFGVLLLLPVAFTLLIMRELVNADL